MARTRPSALDPAGLHAERSFDFVQRSLRAARKRRADILEVGCGGGQVARRLMAAGHHVTAIDSSAKAVRAARRTGVPAVHADFLEYDGGPFDAVVFVLSLHHVDSLARAMRNAERLLKPGGLLIADEFGRERIDRATAAWFFDGLDLLDAAGHLKPADPGPYRGPKRRGAARVRGANPAARAAEDPLARWRQRHMHTRTIHTGRALETAIRRRFRIERSEPGPHLFRYPGRRLQPGTDGMRIAHYLLEAESTLIAEGWLRATGLRIVARRRVGSARPTA
jgi:SAM-dependent methyltransferase